MLSSELGGDYFFHGIRRLEGGTSSEEELARYAVDLYQYSLPINHDNIDARLDLASFYLSSSTPEKAVHALAGPLNHPDTN